MVLTKYGRELVFFAVISYLVIRLFQMPPLKDRNPWRRCLSVVVGLAIIAWGVAAIYLGHITFWRDNPQTYIRAREPIDFWLVISFLMLIGGVLMYRGLVAQVSKSADPPTRPMV